MSILSKLDSSEYGRVERCLALALTSANDMEIATSIKGARQILRKHQLTLTDFYRAMVGGDNANITPARSSDSAEVENLHREVDRLKNELSKIGERLKDSERRAEEMKATRPIDVAPLHVPIDGNYTYDAFYSALISHLGSPKRALSIFSEMTAIPAGRIQTWRRTNKVPMDAYDAIPKLQRDEAILGHHQKLTSDHKRRIDRLSIEGKSDAEIAETMNIEFSDRVFNVNMIKGAKTQIRTAFLEDLKFDGKDKESARAAFLARYPSARAIDRLLNKAFSVSGGAPAAAE